MQSLMTGPLVDVERRWRILFLLWFVLALLLSAPALADNNDTARLDAPPLAQAKKVDRIAGGFDDEVLEKSPKLEVKPRF